MTAAHELALVATDGRHLALMPSLGLFYSVADEDSGAEDSPLIERTRLDGRLVEIAVIDSAQGLMIDVLRLTRTMPLVVGELVQMLGWQRASALLSHRVEAVADARQLAKGYSILAHNAVVPAGWLDGMSEPLGSLPVPSELPRLVRLRMNFLDADIELVASRRTLLERLETHLGRWPVDPREDKEPCFLAVVHSKDSMANESRATSFADLEPMAVRALAEAMNHEQTGAFEALVYSEDEEDPSLAQTVELRRLAAWTAEELSKLLASAQAMAVQRDGDPLAYLERVLGRDLDTRELDARAAPVLAQVLNLWAMAAMRGGDAERAAALIEIALACSPAADVLQELVYNRGRALLRTTLPASAREDDELELAGYPAEPRRRQLERWQLACESLARAAELDESDIYAWARLGVANLLLGGRSQHLTIRRRMQLLRLASEAIDRALAEGGAEEAPLERALQTARATLDELSRLPWYRRAFGRHRPISDSVPQAPRSDETGPQPDQSARNRR